MTTYRCDDWTKLVGSRVEIRRHRRTIRAGMVADVMPDSSILWLAADQNDNRAIYEAVEGYEVWADPIDLPDAVYQKMICQKPHAPLVGDPECADDPTGLDSIASEHHEEEPLKPMVRAASAAGVQPKPVTV